MFIATACSLLLSWVQLPAGITPTAGAATDSPSSSVHELLERPVIFDDFRYGSAVFDGSRRTGPAGSLFGANIWQTGPDRSDTLRSRAWYRFNWFEPPVNSRAAFGLNNDGLLIRMGAGYRQLAQYRRDDDGGVPAHPPVLVSGFVLAHGSYFARVRFSDLEAGRQIQQAFWTTSPFRVRMDDGSREVSYWSEIDHEWNNWFHGSEDQKLSTGHHYRTGSYENTRMGATRGILRSSCRRIAPDGVVHYWSSRECGDFISGRSEWGEAWMVLGIHFSDDGVAYSMSSEGPWGRVEAASRPATRLQPLWPMSVMFSQHLIPQADPSRRNYNPEPELTVNHDMYVDWFYYTPETDVTDRQVRRNVDLLRSEGLERVNTTGVRLTRPYEQDNRGRLVPDHSLAAEIAGPSAVAAREQAAWHVIPSVRIGRYEVSWYTRPLGETSWRQHPERGPRLRLRVPSGDFEIRTVITQVADGTGTAEVVKQVRVE